MALDAAGPELPELEFVMLWEQLSKDKQNMARNTHMKFASSNDALDEPALASEDAPLKAIVTVCDASLRPNALQLIWHPLALTELPSTSARLPPSTLTLNRPAFELTTLFKKTAVPSNRNVRLSPATLALSDELPQALDVAQLEPW